MTTEEKTITILKASEGKWIRRKSDGTIYGETVWLGNNHYDADLPISPTQDTVDDFEEIDKPEDTNTTSSFSNKDRLLRMEQIINQEKTNINNYDFSEEDALEVKHLFPIWGKDIVDGTSLTKGYRFQYTIEGNEDSTLYEVVQDHTVQLQYPPSISTAALYNAINVVASGTITDPITYTPPMLIYNGKYYVQNNVVYLCTRDSGIALSHDLSVLVGLYVSIVN